MFPYISIVRGSPVSCDIQKDCVVGWLSWGRDLADLSFSHVCLLNSRCKRSPTSLWTWNIWAWITPSCHYTKGATNAFTVIQLYTLGKKFKLIGQTKEGGSFGRHKRLPDSTVLPIGEKNPSCRPFIHKWRPLITQGHSHHPLDVRALIMYKECVKSTLIFIVVSICNFANATA